MKTKIIKPLLLPIISTVPLSYAISCGNHGQMPIIHDVTIEKPSFYQAAMIDMELHYVDFNPFFRGENPLDARIYHFNNSPITYVDIDDFVYSFMSFDEIVSIDCNHFSSYTKDYKTYIVNNTKYISDGKLVSPICIIDYNNQTISYSDYNAFFTFMDSSSSLDPFSCTTLGSLDKYIIESKSEYHSSNKIRVIDLKKYNIPIYFYQGHGYIPFEVIVNIISPRFPNSLFCNGKDFFVNLPSIKGLDLRHLYQKVFVNQNIINQQYFEYCYNLLALTIDTNFGLPKRNFRYVEGDEKYQFFPNGAYDALSPFHDKLVNTQVNEFDKTLYSVFAQLFDDGGHSSYSGKTINSDASFDSIDLPKGEEYTFIGKILDTMSKTRDDKSLSPDQYWMSPDRQEHRKTEAEIQQMGIESYAEVMETTNKNGTEKFLFVTFDGFDSARYYLTPNEQLQQKILPESVTDDTYCYDTIRLAMYINNQMHNSSDIKHLVFDISNNTGGSGSTLLFILGMICGQTHIVCGDTKTGSWSETTYKLDLNNDKIFDENDYLPTDVDITFITSPGSFSCGNLFPTLTYLNLKDSNRIHFIGDQTGGGPCFVQGNQATGLGSSYQISGASDVFFDFTQEIKNATTLDDGVGPNKSDNDVYYPLYDFQRQQFINENFLKYYDRENILSLIAQKW